MAARTPLSGAGAGSDRWAVRRGDAGYPAHLGRLLGSDAPDRLHFCGPQGVFPGNRPWLALAVSVRCPGDAILATYDLAVRLREWGVGTIGGFHSPMEAEALRLLLRGQQPVVLCPARSLERMRMRPEWRAPLAESRLLLLSPFAASVRRATEESASFRNRLVAALADALLVVHAQPGGKTEAVAREALAWGKRVYTLDLPANEHLLAAGIAPFDLEAWPFWT